jgi:hypothetical protein
MKKFFTIFFIILGVVFFLILMAIAYLFIADPFNIKPFIFNTAGSSAVVEEVRDNGTTANEASDTEASAITETKSTNLSPAQAGALEAVGIDPATVPQSFTPAQLTCFETILGAKRVGEIKAGATPTIPEFYAAKGCI